MGADGQFFGQVAAAKNLDAVEPAIGQTAFAHQRLIDARLVFELVQRIEIDRMVSERVTCIIKSTFGNAPDQRHLAAFKPDADRTARTSRLAFATAAAGFSVAAGFTMAQALAPMLSAWTRFEIM